MFELFALILCFAVVFFLAGFYFENYPTFMVSGVGFLLLAIAIYTTGLTMQTGVTSYYVYGNNFTDYHWDDYGEPPPSFNPSDDVVFIFHTVEENVYETSEGIANQTLGLFLLIMSFFAFGCSLIYATPKKDQGNNPDHIEYNFY